MFPQFWHQREVKECLFSFPTLPYHHQLDRKQSSVNVSNALLDCETLPGQVILLVTENATSWDLLPVFLFLIMGNYVLTSLTSLISLALIVIISCLMKAGPWNQLRRYETEKTNNGTVRRSCHLKLWIDIYFYFTFI